MHYYRVILITILFCEVFILLLSFLPKTAVDQVKGKSPHRFLERPGQYQ